jgi:hypothetical protein
MSAFDADRQVVAAEQTDIHGAAVAAAPAPVSHGQARPLDAQTSGELVAMSFPGARRIAGWLFWVVFPLLCVWATILGISSIANHVGTHPPGIAGTFSAQRSCSHGICSVTGTFVANEGGIAIGALRGDPTWLDGSVHAVYYYPRKHEIIATDNWDATPAILAITGSMIYLVAVLVLGVRAVRQRRVPADRADRRAAGEASPQP